MTDVNRTDVNRVVDLETILENLDDLAHDWLVERADGATGSEDFGHGYERGVTSVGCAVRRAITDLDPGFHDRCAARQAAERELAAR